MLIKFSHSSKHLMTGGREDSMDRLDEIKRLGEVSMDFTAKMLTFFEFSHDLNCIAKEDGYF